MIGKLTDTEPLAKLRDGLPMTLRHDPCAANIGRDMHFYALDVSEVRISRPQPGRQSGQIMSSSLQAETAPGADRRCSALTMKLLYGFALPAESVQSMLADWGQRHGVGWASVVKLDDVQVVIVISDFDRGANSTSVGFEVVETNFDRFLGFHV